jgi:hypothetical protein
VRFRRPAGIEPRACLADGVLRPPEGGVEIRIVERLR